MSPAMTVIERVQHEAMAAANAADIRSLRAYLQGLLDSESIPPETLEAALRLCYEQLRDEGNEEAADLILDGLDLLTAWCGPGQGLRVPA